MGKLTADKVNGLTPYKVSYKKSPIARRVYAIDFCFYVDEATCREHTLIQLRQYYSPDAVIVNIEAGKVVEDKFVAI